MDDTASRSGEEDELDEAAQSVTSLPCSSRQMRNQAEKQRRDKLNQFINELAMLVPMVASSAKRLDKTSILRLSATFLRMHQILNKNKEKSKQPNQQLTVPINWCQLMLEGLDGMLLVVTSTGKIVFISHTVENLLGHSQTDLLGQSLFNITSLEDHEILKENLTPASEELLDGPSTSAPLATGNEIARQRKPERRSFYLRLRHKSTPRGEQPHYETVHVMGHLRVPSPPPPPAKRGTAGSSSSTDSAQHMSHEIVLVAVMQPFKEKRITQFSLLEASREEWISRHLIDGTIVFSDHRISVVSGYMAEEVNGNFAFKYMHQEDARWVLVALRQMYHHGESYGKSCYRLMSKTGEFIYIRTHGYLELNEDNNSVQSFVCINTLVSKEEGEKQIKEMKEMFTPIVKSRDSSVATITSGSTIPQEESGSTGSLLRPLMVDDPGELNNAIELLLSDLPADQIHPRNPEAPGPDEQYAKCAMVSKTLMPPVHVHSSKVGVVRMPMIKKSPRYSRPSVITRVKEKRVSGEEQTTTKKPRPSCTPSSEPSCPPIPATLVDTNRSVIRSRNDYMEVSSGDASSFVASSLPVVQYSTSPHNYVAPSPPNSYVIASPQDDQISYLSSPNDMSNSLLLDPSPSSSSVRQPVELFLNDMISVDGLDSRLQYPSLPEPIDDPLQVGTLDTLGFWESDVETLEAGVVRSQLQLEERIQFQDTQISAIEEDLTLVPMSSEGNHIYRSTFTHLKAEHRKQQQMLKTIKEDHHNMQQCNKDQLTVRGAQDIGV